MRVYRLTCIPSVADYVRGLCSLRVHEDQRRLFECHYHAPQRTQLSTLIMAGSATSFAIT